MAIPTPWDGLSAEGLKAMAPSGELLKIIEAYKEVYRRGWADAMKEQARANEQHLGDVQDAGEDA